MPYYRVRVEGTGISVPVGESIAVGFFTTRAVRAPTAEAAVDKVRMMIAAAWTTGKYASWNQGVAPTITLDEVRRSSWLRDLRFRNDGHSFYLADEGEAEASRDTGRDIA